MPSIRAHRLVAPAILCTGLIAGTATAGGGQEPETAYHNFPEVPSGWIITGCCQGAIVADDIEVTPGTEGMRLDEIQVRLWIYENGPDFTLHVYGHDDDTGLPGALLGSQNVPSPPAADGFTVLAVDAWSLDIRVPASGRLWIGIHVPAGNGGWNVADAEPSVGSTENLIARRPDQDDSFSLYGPDEIDEIQFMNLMLRVDVLPDPCPADVNGDNLVDVTDMVTVILEWGCTDACAADVNADGVVDIQDLVEVVLAWGPCFDV